VAARQVELENIEQEERFERQTRSLLEEKRRREGEEWLDQMARESYQAKEARGGKRLEEERVENGRLAQKERAEQKAREEAAVMAQLVAKQKRLMEERVENEMLAEKERAELKAREEAEAAATAQLVAKQKRLEEERAENERLAEKEWAKQMAREEAAATAQLVAQQKRLEDERVENERLAEKGRLKRLEREREEKVEAEAAENAAKKRNILEEMDHLEETIPKSFSLDEEKEQVVLEREIHAPTLAVPSMNSVSLYDEEKFEEEELEHEDLESLSIMDMKAQSDKFLARIRSSGIRTPLSFLSSRSYIDSTPSFNPEEEKLHDSEHEEYEDELVEWMEDDLSVLPTVSHSSNMDPHERTMTSSPITPRLSTPSPNSLTGATRLEMGSPSHLGDESQLPIFGRVQQIEESKQSARNALTSDTSKLSSKACSRGDSTGDMYQNSLGTNSLEGNSTSLESKDDDSNGENEALSTGPSKREQQPPKPSFSAPRPKFTRLRDLLDTSKEEIPFDEIPFVSKSMSSASSSGIARDSPQSIDKSHTPDASNVSPGLMTMLPLEPEDCDSNYEDSYDEETAPDVLSQFSDAALFGVTDFVTEITASVKGAVSHLVNGRRNNIDDDGPIKIGEKYYSHNEALRLWRKSKVKLVDQYHDVDKEGSVFQEKARKKKVQIIEEDYEPKQANDTKGKGVDRVVTINELITRYKWFEKSSKSIDENTVMARNVVKNNEGQEEPDKSSLLSSVDESKGEKTTVSEEAPGSFEVDTDTTESESETKSSDGSDGEIATFVSETTFTSGGETTFTSAGETTFTSEASHVESESSGSDSSVKNDAINLKKSMTRTRASNSQATTPPRTDGSSTTPPIHSNNKNVHKYETDSVAGKNSLPSHMGSNYGVEVTSLRGMHCNFINSNSSEQVKIGGGKSIRKDCEQSVLGSQYGTEVLFKPKKVVTARKPRTLASHNMGVKSAKQTNTGAKGSVKQASMGAKSTVKQINMGAKGTTVKQNSGNEGSLISKQKRSVATPSPRTTPKRTTPTRMKLHKKLKLGLKKTTKS